MSIFGSNIREELTLMLGEHLATKFRERFFRGDDGGWHQVAEDAMDFIYGEEPDSETPESNVQSGDQGCCGGPDGSGSGCDGAGGGTGVRNAFTGVVDPPTTGLQIGSHWYGDDRQSPTGEPGPAQASGDASTAR